MNRNISFDDWLDDLWNGDLEQVDLIYEALNKENMANDDK
jgi:hypothetical protein